MKQKIKSIFPKQGSFLSPSPNLVNIQGLSTSRKNPVSLTTPRHNIPRYSAMSSRKNRHSEKSITKQTSVIHERKSANCINKKSKESKSVVRCSPRENASSNQEGFVNIKLDSVENISNADALLEDTGKEIGAKRVHVFKSQLCCFHSLAAHRERDKESVKLLLKHKREQNKCTLSKSLTNDLPPSKAQLLTTISKELQNSSSNSPAIFQKVPAQRRDVSKKKINQVPCFPELHRTHTPRKLHDMSTPLSKAFEMISELEEKPARLLAYVDDEQEINELIKESFPQFNEPLKKLSEAARRKKEANEAFEAVKSEILGLLQEKEEAQRHLQQEPQMYPSDKSASSVSTNTPEVVAAEKFRKAKRALPLPSGRDRSLSILK